MNLIRKVENTDPSLFWVWIGIMIVGLVVAVVFGWLTFYFRQRERGFQKTNRESNTVWEFTKKNFPTFVACFGLVLFITGLMFAIQTT